MNQIWISKALLLGIIAGLAGCAGSTSTLLPAEETMLDIWAQQTGGTNLPNAGRQLLDARATLRRPFDPRDGRVNADEQRAFTRTARNEIYSQFRRLPNPDLVMYVYPHLAGTDPVPVPGYTTVFPLYQRVEYALPGERTEEY